MGGPCRLRRVGKARARGRAISACRCSLQHTTHQGGRRGLLPWLGSSSGAGIRTGVHGVTFAGFPPSRPSPTRRRHDAVRAHHAWDQHSGERGGGPVARTHPARAEPACGGLASTPAHAQLPACAHTARCLSRRCCRTTACWPRPPARRPATTIEVLQNGSRRWGGQWRGRMVPALLRWRGGSWRGTETVVHAACSAGAVGLPAASLLPSAPDGASYRPAACS